MSCEKLGSFSEVYQASLIRSDLRLCTVGLQPQAQQDEANQKKDNANVKTFTGWRCALQRLIEKY